MTYPKLCCKEIRVTSKKISVLPSGSLSQAPNLDNFAAASRWCSRQNSLTVELVDYTDDASTGWNCTYTVVQQLARFRPTPRVARSVCGSGDSCRNSEKGKGSPYSIRESRVPELIPVLGSQPAGDVSHKPGGRLPLLSARPGLQLPPQPLRGLLPVLLLGEQRHDGCEQFA